MELIFFLEKPEEDRINELRKYIENGAFFYSTYNFDTETNLKRFCNRFNSEFNDISEIKDFVIKESKIDKLEIIIKNIEGLISKENTEFIDFLNDIKERDVRIIALSKENSEVEELMNGKLKEFITSIDKSKPKNYFNITYSKSSDDFVYYSIFGLNERYRQHINNNKSIRENISQLLLKKDSIFLDEPFKILKKELRSLEIYNKIMQVIAKGADTLNVISDSLKITTSCCNKYLNVLISLKVVSKINSVYGGDTRKSRYIINNNLFRFYYYFIPDIINEIELENTDTAFDYINEDMDNYTEIAYKDVCSDYITKLAQDGNINIDIQEDGMWWDRKEKIDIVKGNSLQVIVADCFWQNGEVGKKEYFNLKEKAEKLDVVDRRYFIFAKKGFSGELKNMAKNDRDITLVSFEEMINSKEEKGKYLFFFSKK